MSEEITWGDISIWGTRVPSRAFTQPLEGFRTGPEIERVSQQGMTKIRFGDFSTGGMARMSGIYSATRDLNLIARNEGIQTRLLGLACLPYVLTTQAAVTAYNISALGAANMRVHSFLSSLGDSGLRWMGALGVRLLGDTSVSDPAVVSRNTFTNSVLSVAEQVLNSTTYAAFATNGQTDDILGTTDVSGSGAPTFVSLATYSNASDGISAMAYFPQWKRNVWVGQFGGTNGVWSVKDTEAIPVTSPSPVVFTATKDNFNASATVQSSGPVYPRAMHSSVWDGATRFTSETNVFANDGSNASTVANSANTHGGVFMDLGYGFRALPTSAVISGYVVEIEAFESAATVNAFTRTLMLVKNNDLTGANENMSVDKGDGGVLVTEWALTTPTIMSYGGSSDRWNIDISVAELKEAGFGIIFNEDQVAIVGENASVDFIRLTVYYTLGGTQVVLNKGGFTCGKVPWDAALLPYVQPVRDDVSAITVPRELVYLRFDFDSDGDRLTANLEKPATGLNYIWHMKPYQGGVAIIGGHKAADRGRFLKHVDSQGNVRDLGFPGVHGTTPVFINSLEVQGEWLILDVWNTDGTDRQWWFYRNGKYYADTILQSLSGTTVAALGLPWAESALNLQQSRMYSIYPASTNVGVARQFIPDDLSADPHLLNTTEVKSMAFVTGVENTALRMRTVELDVGPEEAEKSVVVVSYQRRNISASSTVTVDLVTDADTTFASPEVTKEFTTAFQDYNVPSSGVAYDTLIARFGGKHTAANAATPNLIPILVTTVQQWLHLPTYDFVLDMSKMGPDYFTKLDAMIAAQASKPTQKLRFANVDVPAVFETYMADDIRVPARGSPPNSNDFSVARMPVWRFRQVKGTTSA